MVQHKVETSQELTPFYICSADPKVIESHASAIAQRFAEMPLPECKASEQFRPSHADQVWKLVVSHAEVRQKLLQMADRRLKFSVIFKHIRNSLALDLTRKDLALMMRDVLGEERYREQYNDAHLRSKQSKQKSTVSSSSDLDELSQNDSSLNDSDARNAEVIDSLVDELRELSELSAQDSPQNDAKVNENDDQLDESDSEVDHPYYRRKRGPIFY